MSRGGLKNIQLRGFDKEDGQYVEMIGGDCRGFMMFFRARILGNVIKDASIKKFLDSFYEATGEWLVSLLE